MWAREIELIIQLLLLIRSFGREHGSKSIMIIDNYYQMIMVGS
jgi:hypothetical protein